MSNKKIDTITEQKLNPTPAQEPEVNTTSAQEPEINEVDGEPIFHAPDEEGDGTNE